MFAQRQGAQQGQVEQAQQKQADSYNFSLSDVLPQVRRMQASWPPIQALMMASTSLSTHTWGRPRRSRPG